MKRIKQTVLNYREGTSDKVYEVDLCEVGPNQYVVNFRYGRRGAKLKDGTKTLNPVPLAEAQRAFDSLVDSKIKKGYRDVATPEAAASAPRPAQLVPRAADGDARKQAILDRLVLGDTPAKGLRPLERAIWRAGELKLREAVPCLLDLLGKGNALRDYCIAWALGWSGDDRAVPPLSRLYTDSATPDAVRRMAGEALLKLSDEATRVEFANDMLENLPPELREPARKGPAEAFASALRAYLDGGGHARFAILDSLYWIDNEHVRPVLLEVLRTAPLRPNYFQRLRHIFKAAEYRRDVEVFGILAYRFEKERAMFRNDHNIWYLRLESGERIKKEDLYKRLKDPGTKLAYGSKTRWYLRRRVWRTLRRLGQLGDADYVKMAVGVLLPYTDGDALPVRETVSSHYEGGRYQTRTTYWDAYASYWAFNHLLYRHSPRYLLKRGSKAWQCKPPYKPGDPEPQVREEAFPKLWEQVPAGLVHLLAESHCRPVHHFAAKVLRACKDFCAELDLETVIMLLGRPYEVTAALGFDLAKRHYRSFDPNHELVLALANCAYQEGRAQAHRWIDENRGYFVQDSALVVSLVTSSWADTRAFARDLLRTATLTTEMAQALIARLVAHLMTLGPAQAEQARDISATILQSFGPQLRTLGMLIVLDLLAHPLLEVQELAGNILLNHETKAAELPEDIFRSLINSPFEAMRGIGIKLFDQLPDETALLRLPVYVVLAMHQLPDVRNAARPVIRRLGAQNPTFGERIAAHFVDMLLRHEPHEGVHAHLTRLLREDLSGYLAGIPMEAALALTRAKTPSAQEMGGYLLQDRPDWIDGLDTLEIARLAGHDIKAVREASWTLFTQALPRVRGHPAEMAKSLRILDSKWEDSREFACRTFRDAFGPADFTPAILVSICDSVRPEVQQFGRELITRYFREENGQEYLLKLSEHPSAELQVFATNYLERYAAGDPERLRTLKPYFLSVLSRVNRGRVAKSRVLAFLAAEAQKSEAAARIIADILSRQSATIAVGDKAKTLEVLLQIHSTYPTVPVPVSVQTPEVRHAL